MFANFYFILIITSFHASNSEEIIVKYYENLIETRTKYAENFQPPADAKIYKPKDESPPEDFGTYDFVIIGAGSTGTVIANRLSEIENWKILLLEAGSYGDNFTEIPSMNSEVTLSEYNWAYRSVPQKTACLGIFQQECPFPRGRGVGGSTLINGLAYVRGHPIDFDKWAELGNPGWSYDEVLPYFKKSENVHKTNPMDPVNDKFHGNDGYLSVEYYLNTSTHLEAFLRANQELGFNLTDYNSPQQIGASPIQQNTKHGHRADGGSAFILPILGRSNLKIMTESFVIKLHVVKETRKVACVHFSHNGKIYSVRARKEVIVSAGAIASPQLLMLSGIGPQDHLEKFHIPVIQHLEVGSTLRDHSQYYGLTYASNISVPGKPLAVYIKEYLMGTGPFTLPGPNTGIGFYQSSLEKTPNYPDFEIILVVPNATSKAFQKIFHWDEETFEATWGGIDITGSFSMYVINLHQLSIGTIRLRSDSPYDYPLIDPRFLSDSENKDIQVLYEGIQFVMKLISTEAFKEIGARFQAKPLPACKQFEEFTKEYWYCCIRQLSVNVYHPVGTCPMGPDPREGAVVDNKLKVYGIENLRVADGSVFPITISGHPNAACVMVGEKVSDFIKTDYGELL